MTFQFWWQLGFGDISVLVTFQFQWHLVLVTFQCWWNFSFGDILVLVTFQCWWHFRIGDISVLVTWAAAQCSEQPITNQQLRKYSAYLSLIDTLSISEILKDLLIAPSVQKLQQFSRTGQIGCTAKTYISLLANKPTDSSTVHGWGVKRFNGPTYAVFFFEAETETETIVNYSYKHSKYKTV